MKGKIYKFVMVPIMVVLNDEGEPTDELPMKQIVHFVGNEIDLKVIAADLEHTANVEYFDKKANIDTASSGE